MHRVQRERKGDGLMEADSERRMIHTLTLTQGEVVEIFGELGNALRGRYDSGTILYELLATLEIMKDRGKGL